MVVAMLYLVGGCSRSGKSTLAERIRARQGVPWFPLDALKMGLHLGASSYGVHPDEDDLLTADRMWPVVRGLLEHLIFDGRDYVVEGVNLRPQTVAEFMQETDEPVKACFLGFPETVIEIKAKHVALHTGTPTDWLKRTGPDNMLRYLEVSRTLSRHLRDDCSVVKIPFFDTGPDFHAGLESAEHALIGSAEGARAELPPSLPS